MPSKSGGGGGGHAVLSGPGFGHDALLAHAFDQQSLTHGVVDLVRAGMRQILPFQVDLGSAQVLAETPGVGDGRGTTDVVRK